MSVRSSTAVLALLAAAIGSDAPAYDHTTGKRPDSQPPMPSCQEIDSDRREEKRKKRAERKMKGYKQWQKGLKK